MRIYMEVTLPHVKKNSKTHTKTWLDYNHIPVSESQ